MKRLVFLSAVMLSLLAACSRSGTELLTVASETRACSGVGEWECMLVRHGDAQQWEYFYGNIAGFDYEPGYEYVLRVKKEEVTNPPQDASSIKYTLVKVVSKEKVASQNLLPERDGR